MIFRNKNHSNSIVAPAGRLTQTWYYANYTELSMFDMNMRPNTSTGNPGYASLQRHVIILNIIYFRRGYRFFTGPAVYPFGYGLRFQLPSFT